jgi:hypothetical protein
MQVSAAWRPSTYAAIRGQRKPVRQATARAIGSQRDLTARAEVLETLAQEFAGGQDSEPPTWIDADYDPSLETWSKQVGLDASEIPAVYAELSESKLAAAQATHAEPPLSEK